MAPVSYCSLTDPSLNRAAGTLVKNPKVRTKDDRGKRLLLSKQVASEPFHRVSPENSVHKSPDYSYYKDPEYEIRAIVVKDEAANGKRDSNFYNYICVPNPILGQPN